MRRRAPDLTFRTDAIGLVSVLGDDAGAFARRSDTRAPTDVRLRFAAQSPNAAAVELCSTRSRRSIAPGRPAAPACADG